MHRKASRRRSLIVTRALRGLGIVTKACDSCVDGPACRGDHDAMPRSIKRLFAFADRVFRMSVKTRLRRQFLKRLYLAA